MGVFAAWTKIAKIVVLMIVVGVGGAVIYEGYSSALGDIPSDQPIIFQKTMTPSIGPTTGTLKINMTPTKAFVIGDLITATIEIDVFGINWEQNETCNVMMIFLDAICYVDTWSNITYQDWHFVWWDYQSHNAVYAIYYENVLMRYVHEGLYGVNITVWEPGVGEFGYNQYSYSDLVQIKPYTYIEDVKRTQLAQALNIEVIGLAVIAVAPVFVQIIEITNPKKEK